MIERRTRILAGLLVLLAAVPEAIPQTVRSGAPTRQVAPRKAGKPGNNGSSAATGPMAMPALCFQDGVGWQRLLPDPPGAHATQGPDGSIGLEASHSTGAAHAQSNAQQDYAAGCAGTLINQKAFGAGIEKLTTLHGPQTMRFAGSAKPGDLPYHPHRGSGIEPVGMVQSAPTYLASDVESEMHPDQVGVRTFHAYTSSIKLRRLIRNAPDFRTRIQLQQLETNPQPHKAGAPQRQARRPGGERSVNEQTKHLHGDRILTTGSQSVE